MNNNYIKYLVNQTDAALNKNNGGLKWLMMSAHDTNLILINTILNISSA